MLTYTLIDGGYQIIDDGKIAIFQPFNPSTGEPFTPEEATIVAEEYISNQTTILENTVSTLKTTQEERIRIEGSKRLSDIASPYLPEERDTWPTQLAEATAWLANNTAPTPMVDALAAARGIPKADLITKIMGNADLFRTASGNILGQQQALLDQIDALPLDATDAQIRAIDWI